MRRRFLVSMPGCACALITCALGCATPEDLDGGGDSGAGGGGASSGGSGGAAAGTKSSGGVPNFAGAPSGGGAGSAGSPMGGAAGSAGTPGSAGSSGSGGSSGGGGTVTKCVSALPCFEDFEDSKADNWLADTVDANADKVGNWAIIEDAGNRVYAQQTEYSDDSWAIGGSLSWTDQRVEVKAKFTSPAEDAQIYVAARFASLESYYFMYLNIDGSLRIRKRLNGSTTDIVPTQRPAGLVPAPNTWYTLVLEARGNTLTAYVNDMMVGTGTDAAPLANGGIGLGVVDGTVAFDDVRVSTP